ncbi:hypothetical protein RHODGE_RHODGE_01937 [Rhodoplanes serenus]|uniref:Uncharacterized protein n=1 Tax=Rhodoplanes serenus TaxID=200615 RepID=A0A3S4B0K1_9BRAD|nr:hypothetical protein RHODGE_RHODGE_01937 [Rhodoplanes serenus]
MAQETDETGTKGLEREEAGPGAGLLARGRASRECAVIADQFPWMWPLAGSSRSESDEA